MISNLIKEIQRILAENQRIASVYTYEPEELVGDPVAIVVPSGNESDYKTTNENERVYAFTIRLIISRTVREKDESDAVLRTLLESVLDDFDKNYSFSGIETPSGYQMINVFALPSQWGYTGGEDEYRVVEVNVRCRVYVDVTQIS